MFTINKILKLILHYSYLSLMEVTLFKFELAMKILQEIFAIAFLIVFWYSINYQNIIIEGWEYYELLVLTGFVMLSGSIRQLILGFRDLQASIINGNFDVYLTKPFSPIFLILLKNIKIFKIGSSVITGTVILVIVKIVYSVDYVNILPSVLLMVIGSFTYNLIYASISLLSFKFGKIDSLRDMIFSMSVSSKYPITIFPNPMIYILTYLLPISFIGTYPTELMLGKKMLSIELTISALVLLFAWIAIYSLLWKKAKTRYQSTGN